MPVLEQQTSVRLPSGGRLLRKRAFDIVCAALGLLVLSPVLLMCALLVGLTSPGGVLFRQERMGRDGVPFTIYKFRSMRKDNAGLKISTSSDSRITPVGRVLRKTKLDELPQLWNVLKGDMSFVQFGTDISLLVYDDQLNYIGSRVLATGGGSLSALSMDRYNERLYIAMRAHGGTPFNIGNQTMSPKPLWYATLSGWLLNGDASTGTISPELTTEKAKKVVIDGRLYIRKGNQVFNALGQQL